MYEGPDAQGLESIFVLGNGPSRKNIDISKLDGTVIGCNACHRDFTPDVICATDAGIMSDIIESGYDGQCYFTHNSWNLLPEEAYDSLANGTEHTTYRRFDSEYFVYISGLDNKVSKTQSYIIWIPKGMENKIKNMGEKVYGWSTGTSALHIACRDFTCNDYEKVYLLGFDHHNNYYDNIYADTDHYYSKGSKADIGSWSKVDGWKAEYNNWDKQLFKVIEEHPALQFIWVNYCGDDFPKLPNLFSKDEEELWQR
jgi:hypothetical protein